jgi:hypothetical protein
MPSRVKVDIGIDELGEVIAYHLKIANGIPKERESVMTMAGWPLGVTKQRHLVRARELSRIYEDKWPK